MAEAIPSMRLAIEGQKMYLAMETTGSLSSVSAVVEEMLARPPRLALLCFCRLPRPAEGFNF